MFPGFRALIQPPGPQQHCTQSLKSLLTPLGLGFGLGGGFAAVLAATPEC